MSLSTTQITESFIDPTTGQPFSNINVSFQVSQVLYIGGIPAVTPASPVAAEVTGGQLLAASGAPLALADQGNPVTLQSGTGFWWWTVTITGAITDSWSFMLAHSASPVELYSLKNTPAVFSGGTLTQFLAPAVAALTDAATIAVNAALGNEFAVTLGGNRTFGAPSNPHDGQTIRIRITQPSSGGPYTPSFASGTGGYAFGTTGAPSSWSTAAGATDLIGFDYNLAKNEWMFLGQQQGF